MECGLRLANFTSTISETWLLICKNRNALNQCMRFRKWKFGRKLTGGCNFVLTHSIVIPFDIWYYLVYGYIIRIHTWMRVSHTMHCFSFQLNLYAAVISASIIQSLRINFDFFKHILLNAEWMDEQQSRTWTMFGNCTANFRFRIHLCCGIWDGYEVSFDLWNCVCSFKGIYSKSFLLINKTWPS